SGVFTTTTGSGRLAIIKEGTGTQTFTGANTTDIAFTVNAGTFLANTPAPNSATGTSTSNVTVNSGGTLGGNGNAAGAVTVNAGGFIAPGPATGVSVGTLTLGTSLTVNGTYTADVATAPNANDQIALTGNLTLNT